jgi:putative nucleotidyltransferase with HDIG domain
MSTDIRILLVEDSEDDAELLLREIRRGGYAPFFRRVSSQAEMLKEVKEHEWDIILSDYAMPGFSGAGALEVWKENGLDIPFIIISGTIGEETAVMMMKAGASDYMMKQNLARLTAAISRELRDARVRRERRQAEYMLRDSERRFSLFMDHFPGLVFIQDVYGQMLFVNQQFKEAFPTVDWVGQRVDDVLSADWAGLFAAGYPQAGKERSIQTVGYVQGSPGGRWFEMTKFLIPRENAMALLGGFALDVTERMKAEADLRKAKQDLEEAYEKTLEGWARALELHERETYGHSQNVVELAVELAKEMGLPDDELQHVRRGALMHDIGKMGIPESILLKPGKLDSGEWAIVRQHPRMAYDLLSQIEFLGPAIDIPYSHHEKWDGSGYPRMLSGENIPLKARIFSVVDVFRALREKRSYSDIWPEEKALEYIASQAGIHFDPHVVDVFLHMMAQKNPDRIK